MERKHEDKLGGGPRGRWCSCKTLLGEKELWHTRIPLMCPIY